MTPTPYSPTAALTDAQMIDRVARAWASMDGSGPFFALSKLRPDITGDEGRTYSGYMADAKELLTRAGIIAPTAPQEGDR